MGVGTSVKQSDVMALLDESQKEIRRMVMDGYDDMQKGKGRDYKEFFVELESRYRDTVSD